MGLQKGSIRSFFYALRKPNLKAMTKHKTQKQEIDKIIVEGIKY